METLRTTGTAVLCLGFCLGLAGAAVAEPAERIATVEATPEGLKWHPARADRHLVLTVSGPKTRIERKFEAGNAPWLAVRDEKRGSLPEGSYSWELRAEPKLDKKSREYMARAREARDQGRDVDLEEIAKLLEGPFVQSGAFSVADGRLVGSGEPEPEPERESEGDLQVAGNLEVRGKKAFAAVDPSSASTIVYVALEGPEAGTYFRGTAETQRGEAVIELPGHFAQVTEKEGLTVQLTPRGRWSRLYVARVTPERLVVRDAGEGTVEFNFLVQGVRRGHADHRVERAPDLDE